MNVTLPIKFMLFYDCTAWVHANLGGSFVFQWESEALFGGLFSVGLIYLSVFYDCSGWGFDLNTREIDILIFCRAVFRLLS